MTWGKWNEFSFELLIFIHFPTYINYLIGLFSVTWLSLLFKGIRFFIYFLFLSDEGPTLEKLSFIIRIGSIPIFHISFCMSTQHMISTRQIFNMFNVCSTCLSGIVCVYVRYFIFSWKMATLTWNNGYDYTVE